MGSRATTGSMDEISASDNLSSRQSARVQDDVTNMAESSADSASVMDWKFHLRSTLTTTGMN
jgi:hypothetical protein